MSQADFFELDEQEKTGRKRDESVIIYPFDKYKVEVKVDSEGKFLGISGIRIKADFVPVKNRLSLTGYLDLSKVYPEDSEEDIE